MAKKQTITEMTALKTCNSPAYKMNPVPISFFESYLLSIDPQSDLGKKIIFPAADFEKKCAQANMEYQTKCAQAKIDFIVAVQAIINLPILDVLKKPSKR